jgi:uncharacterized membrane protein
MNGEHPWRDWLVVLLIFGGGLVAVMIFVKLIIIWAHKDEDDRASKDPDDTGRKVP